MKILILPSGYPDNAADIRGVFVRDQAVALGNAGHRVSVIAPKLYPIKNLFRSNDESFEICEDDSGVMTYRKYVCPTSPRIPYSDYFLWKLAVIRLFKQFVKERGRPDIIHAHSLIYGGIVAAELGKKHNIPVVLTEHSTGFANNIYKPWQLRLACKAVDSFAYRIAVSEPFANLLERQLGGGWAYVPNIVAERFILEAENKKQVDNSPPVILNLALMQPKKGQKSLIEAIVILKDCDVCVDLWMAGDGAIRSELEKHVAQAGLSHQVRFLGNIKPAAVPVLMAKADLLIISSEYETFGVVAAEALMLGKPVVATRCGGPESIIEKGDGVLVPPKSPAALADGVHEVLGSLSSFNANLISMRALERFGPNAITGKLSKIYMEVLQGQRQDG